MFVDTILKRIVFNFVFLFTCFIIFFMLFHNIYTANSIIIPFALHPFDICEKYPDIWLKLKLIYIPITFISSLIWANILYSHIFTKKKEKSNNTKPILTSDLNLNIVNTNKTTLILPESSLYQNILITGTIGSGKTSSAMYPFTRQLIKYKYNVPSLKLGMLILDVKGNYYSQVQKYAEYYRRKDDLIVISLRW